MWLVSKLFLGKGEMFQLMTLVWFEDFALNLPSLWTYQHSWSHFYLVLPTIFSLSRTKIARQCDTLVAFFWSPSSGPLYLGFGYELSLPTVILIRRWILNHIQHWRRSKLLARCNWRKSVTGIVITYFEMSYFWPSSYVCFLDAVRWTFFFSPSHTIHSSIMNLPQSSYTVMEQPSLLLLHVFCPVCVSCSHYFMDCFLQNMKEQEV